MTSSIRLGALALAIAALSPALAACSTPGTGYSDLDRAPSARDALPTELQPSAEVIDLDTIRFIADDGDWSIWIASGADPAQVCILLFAPLKDSNSSMTACGGTVGGVEGKVTGPGGDYQLLPDGAAPPDSATMLSANVYRIELP